MNFITRFRTWLGDERFYFLIGVVITTGLASFVLAFIDASWTIAVQNALALAAILASAWLIGGRMDRDQQLKWVAILAPAFGLVVLAVVIVQNYYAAFLGVAFGWIIVGLLLFGRAQAPMQYRDAVKAMRKQDYKTAVESMDALIKEEPDMPNHYHFRAQLLRLWGKLGRARRDYQKMAQVSADDGYKAVAYNGLAEVELQAGEHQAAYAAAQQAYAVAPDDWVTVYNLGVIEDRLQASDDALHHLQQALDNGVDDARHRLLIHLYRARAHARLGQLDDAQGAVDQLKRSASGLQEWQKIMADEQASVLRDVLADDITTAEKLIDGMLTARDLM